VVEVKPMELGGMPRKIGRKSKRKGEWRYECPTCGMGFATGISLDEHMYYLHGDGMKEKNKKAFEEIRSAALSACARGDINEVIRILRALGASESELKKLSSGAPCYSLVMKKLGGYKRYLGL